MFGTFFAQCRRWLEELCRITERLLSRAYAEALSGGRPALIVFVLSFGDLVNFNPHLHVLAAGEAFLPNGRFVALPRIPADHEHNTRSAHSGASSAPVRGASARRTRIKAGLNFLLFHGAGVRRDLGGNATLSRGLGAGWESRF
jgi:hypothetical protein